jgi:hypothetical protein
MNTFSLGPEIILAIVAFAAIATIAVRAFWTLWPTRHMRLMRCPETGRIAFVRAEKVSCAGRAAPAAKVRACELWPDKKDCARGCLKRYDEIASGYPINVEALRPFDRL